MSLNGSQLNAIWLHCSVKSGCSLCMLCCPWFQAMFSTRKPRKFSNSSQHLAFLSMLSGITFSSSHPAFTCLSKCALYCSLCSNPSTCFPHLSQQLLCPAQQQFATRNTRVYFTLCAFIKAPDLYLKQREISLACFLQGVGTRRLLFTCLISHCSTIKQLLNKKVSPNTVTQLVWTVNRQQNRCWKVIVEPGTEYL